MMLVMTLVPFMIMMAPSAWSVVQRGVANVNPVLIMAAAENVTHQHARHDSSDRGSDMRLEAGFRDPWTARHDERGEHGSNRD